MESICYQNEIDYPYYVTVDINNNTLGNNDSCWMRCDPLLPTSNLTDPSSFLYSEDESITSGIFQAIVSIFGTILNLLVILAIMRSPDLRKEYLAPSIASITLTDFLYSVYVLPSSSLHNLKRQVDWMEGCNVIGPINLGLWMVSIFNLIGIAGLRCFAINYPRTTLSKSFQYWCTIIPTMAWVSTLTLFLPTLTQQYGRFGLKCRTFACTVINVDTEGNPISPDPIAIYCMIIVFSGVAVIFLNVLSYVQVSKQSQKLFHQIKDTSVEEARKVLRNEQRLQKMVGLITASFLVVYGLPIVFFVVFPNSFYEYPMFAIICIFLGYCLVVIDPLIYIYSSEKYRKEIKRILNPIFSRFRTINEEANDTSGKKPVSK